MSSIFDTMDDYSIISNWFFLFDVQTRTPGRRYFWTYEENECLLMLTSFLTIKEIVPIFQRSRTARALQTQLRNLKREQHLLPPTPLSPSSPLSLLDRSLSPWMQKWANTKAYAMAAKDNKLVRLPRYYSKDDVLHKIMDALRLSRDDTCFYCGRHLLFATYPRVSTATTATIDHLHPMTPLAALNNRAILSCRMCNHGKHAWQFNEFMQLLAQVRSSSIQQPPHIPLSQVDLDWLPFVYNNLRLEHNNIRNRTSYAKHKTFSDRPLISQGQFVDLVTASGLVDPFLHIYGHYGVSATSRDGEMSSLLRMTIGRKVKQTVDPLTDITQVHGFYLENVQPMLMVVKYAQMSSSLTDVHAWACAIRRSPAPAT